MANATETPEKPQKSEKSEKPEPKAADAKVPDVKAAEEVAPEPKVKVKKGKKNIQTGIAFVTASFNNTLVTITDTSGNVISWSSAGVKGFKGSRKSTPFAAQLAAEDAAHKAMDHGMRQVTVLIKGPGSGRESALRALASTGLKVGLIRDLTPVPHNGCRPPKRRRV